MNGLIIFVAMDLIFVAACITFVQWLRFSKSDKISFAVQFAIAGVIAILLSKGIASVFNDPRPFVVDHRVPLFPHVPDNGFPSDHTTLVMMTGMLLTKYRAIVGYIVMAMALLIGTARVLAQVHHLLDISGSVIIAIVAAFAAMALWEKFGKRQTIASPTP